MVLYTDKETPSARMVDETGFPHSGICLAHETVTLMAVPSPASVSKGMFVCVAVNRLCFNKRWFAVYEPTQGFAGANLDCTSQQGMANQCA